MSEQQSGAGYPQQPTSGQPQQPGYPPQYASPQAQYQAQQQYAGYSPQGPSLFDRLGVPSMPAILGLSGLAALVLAGLIAGTSDSTVLGDSIGSQFFGVQSFLSAAVVMFALTLFGGERLRPLWKTLTVAAVALFLGGFLYTLLSLPDSDSGSDASAWIGAILLLGAVGLFLAGAIMTPGSAAANAAAPPAAQQPGAAQQQQAQQPGGYPTGQVGAQPTQQQNQWPQAPQQ